MLHAQNLAQEHLRISSLTCPLADVCTQTVQLFVRMQLAAYTRCDIIANFGEGSPSGWSTSLQLRLSISQHLPVPALLFIDHYTKLSVQQFTLALSKAKVTQHCRVHYHFLGRRMSIEWYSGFIASNNNSKLLYSTEMMFFLGSCCWASVM